MLPKNPLLIKGVFLYFRDMERKNAIKFLKVWGIVTVALILAFRFLLTPLVNAVEKFDF